jgi:heme oxygenase (biliverdin-IX-beta and delta-forming)
MIHSILKQSTSAAHNALESKLRVLLSGEITLDRYVAMQKKFYGFYSPIEARLFSIRGWDDPELKLSGRLKLSLLAGDLEFLSVKPAEIARLPLCDALPRLETVPEALGCLYVLEGSTLGGRIITALLKKVLPLDESRGCSFFNSYGNEVGRMWSSFLAILERHCEQHDDCDVIVRSACQTFASLDGWFSHAA